MSAFPSGFNSPAKLSGPCLVKYGIAQVGGNGGSSSFDTIEMCTAGSSNYNAIADQGNQLPCDFTSTYSFSGGSGTINCGLIALNATLTSNAGTFTLYNANTTATYTPVNLGVGKNPGSTSVIATQVLSVTDTASISSLIVQPTSAATVAKIPTLVGIFGIASSIFFSGLI